MKYSKALLLREMKKASDAELLNALNCLDCFFQELEAFKDCIFNKPSEEKSTREEHAFSNDYSFRIGRINVNIYTSYQETKWHCVYSSNYKVCSEYTTLKRIKAIHEELRMFLRSLKNPDCFDK